MADHSAIEWTDATWNPLRGCSRVSDGCRNCYAEKVAARFSGPGMPYEGLLHPTTKAWNGSVRLVPEKLVEPLTWKQPRRIFVNSMSDLFHEAVPDAWIDRIFAVMALTPQHTYQILTKRPSRMQSYLESFSWELVVASCRGSDGVSLIKRHTMQALEHHFGQRPASPVTSYKRRDRWPLPNVWLGVSVENQATAEERIPLLLQCPAAVRWLSCEPLLGPTNILGHLMKGGQPGRCANCGQGHGFTRCPNYGGVATTHYAYEGGPILCDKFRRKYFAIDWVVAGGESGGGARPMHPDWARALRDQCARANVPFFFKQWGEWGQYVNEDHYTYCGAERQPHAWVDRDTAEHGHCWLVDDDGGWSNYTGLPPMHEDGHILDRVAVVGRFGKRAAGRLLDGREHNAYPEAL